jgi:hypothetical protein
VQGRRVISSYHRHSNRVERCTSSLKLLGSLRWEGLLQCTKQSLSVARQFFNTVEALFLNNGFGRVAEGAIDYIGPLPAYRHESSLHLDHRRLRRERQSNCAHYR